MRRPEAVNIGKENWTFKGGWDHFFFPPDFLSSASSLIEPTSMTSACNRISFPPGKFFIFHRKHSSPAKYRALPPEHKTFTFAVFGGTGMRTLISCATVFSANTDLNMTSTETRVRPNSFTMAMTLNGIETFSDTRYFMSSNSPSGGTNETTLSLANFERFTQ